METTIQCTFQPPLLFSDVQNWLGKVTGFCTAPSQNWPLFISVTCSLLEGSPNSMSLTTVWKMGKLDLVIDRFHCKVIAVKIRLSKRKGTLVIFKISPLSHWKSSLCHLEEFSLCTDQGSFVMPELHWGFPKTSFFLYGRSRTEGL